MRIWHNFISCMCNIHEVTVHNGWMNISGGKDKKEILQEEREDEVLQEAAESNMSGVEADTESDGTHCATL